MTRSRWRTLAFVGFGGILGFLLFAFHPAARALPEYATRTGESCATCHVNPAGGGPRTMRGSLWIAAGRPDTVPQLPGARPEAGGANGAGDALFAQYGCAACHGPAGEGGAGPALNRGELAADKVGKVIRDGQGTMMGLKPANLPEGDLAALVTYVQSIGRGEVKVEAKAGPRKLGAPLAACGRGVLASADGKRCGGN